MNSSRKNKPVDWYRYAQKYDMLLEYNPYYQVVHQEVMALIDRWSLPPGSVLADFGAGTGNYSVACARRQPRLQVLHIENNRSMNALAARKAARLMNFQILERSIENLEFSAGLLHGLLCINALYTFPNPRETLESMNQWLAPGARAVFVDPGRVMRVLPWTFALSWYLLRNFGIRKTLEILREAKSVSEQNAHIREMQRNGSYWTHSHEEFCQAIEAAGFYIEESKTCFRGYCDYVVAVKQ